MELNNKKNIILEAEKYVSKVIPNDSKADRDTVFSLLSHNELIEMIDELFSDIEKIELSKLKEITNNKNLLTIMIKHLIQTGKMDDIAYRENSDEDKIIEDNSLKIYKREIYSYPLITPEEQRNYFIKLEEIKERIRNIPRIKKTLIDLDNALKSEIISEKDYNQALDEIFNSFEEYREQKNIIATRNQRLVKSMAEKYESNKHFKITDIIQIGNNGLLKAIDRFDLSKNYAFSTYAFYWIRQEITKSIPTQGLIIKIPYHLYEDYREWIRINEEINTERDTKFIDYIEIARRSIKKTNPSEKEIRDLANKIEQTFKDIKNVVSLDSPAKNDDDDDSITLGDLQKNEKAINQQNFLENKELVKTILFVLDNDDRVNERHIDVFKRKHGLEGYSPQTLQEISEVYGITREAIRQRLIKVYGVIKDPKYERLFKDYAIDFYEKRDNSTKQTKKNKTKIKKAV